MLILGRRPRAQYARAGAIAFASVAVLSSAPPARAQSSFPSVTNQATPSGNLGSTSAVSGYWTPERMRSAQPLPIPELKYDPGTPGGDAPSATSEAGPTFSGPGGPPTVEVETPLEMPGWEDPPPPPGASGRPSKLPDLASSASLEEPTSVGTLGCHFSSSRLVPQTSDKKYPYRAVGKLFFTKPGIGNFICSGAVLRPRVVVTAGHCVHSGNGQQSGFFTNFVFCPAWRGSPNAKYGCWNWAHLVVTPDWFSSASLFPNAADYAMFEMADNDVEGVPTRIADVVGFFGYQTSALTANHVHMLGYPANFDSGNKMHQVTAARCLSGGNNAELYGSDMRGGSSGGPWVQDFGQLSNGQTVSNPGGPNLIVGITSFTNLDTAPKYLGASIPDARFQTLLDQICAHRAGNC